METLALVNADNAFHKDGTSRQSRYTHISIWAMQSLQPFMLADLDSNSGMLASASGTCAEVSDAFLFAFTSTGARKRHWKNFEFEISPRYAAVVGKARVCLSLSRLRRVA